MKRRACNIAAPSSSIVQTLRDEADVVKPVTDELRFVCLLEQLVPTLNREWHTLSLCARTHNQQLIVPPNTRAPDLSHETKSDDRVNVDALVLSVVTLHDVNATFAEPIMPGTDIGILAISVGSRRTCPRSTASTESSSYSGGFVGGETLDDAIAVEMRHMQRVRALAQSNGLPAPPRVLHIPSWTWVWALADRRHQSGRRYTYVTRENFRSHWSDDRPPPL